MTAEKNDENQKQSDEIKRTRHRSPNYPVIGLRKAVERAGQIFTKYRKASVPIHLVQSEWGYKPYSSSANQCVAALKAFGLVEVDGNGNLRKVTVTDVAYRILGKSLDSKNLLQNAALKPPIYEELWQKYKGEEFPDDSLIKHYLEWDREEGTFNRDVIDPFIENFRDSFRYAGLLPDGTMRGEEQVEIAPEKGGNGASSISAGDFAQWTSQGVDQLPEPLRVTGISDDGQWAFIEGKTTGVPMSELSLQNPKGDTPQPPPNPFYKRADASSLLGPDEVEEKKIFDEGVATLRWPNKLSKESVDDFEYWVEGILRRLRRNAGLPPKDE
jgi:hypothetical protein